MSNQPAVRSLLLSLLMTAAAAPFPVAAQISVYINIAPPTLLHEVVPIVSPGYIWAPGYWAWNVDRYIWVRGRSIAQRDGYRWAPDHWEQRGTVYYRNPGRWERDERPEFVKVKKEKKPGHWKNKHGDDDDHGDDHDRGRGNSGKKDKGNKHDR